MDNLVVPVVFSVDKSYVPYCYLAINSLIKFSDSRRKYDVVVLEKDLDHLSIVLLESLSTYNVKVRCINVKKYTSSADLRRINFLTEETYYRLFIPIILPYYDKILYLDSDMLICKDVAQLYDVDLSDKVAGFVRDVATDWLEKHDRELGDLDYRKCFNAGVFLLDCKKFEIEKIREKALELLRLDYKRKERLYCYADQDLLQIVLYNKVLFLDERWNFQFQYIYRKNVLYKEYLPIYEKAEKESWIIHYAGDKKPWMYPELEGAEYFWKIAKDSHVFMKILIDNFKKNRWIRRNNLKKFKFPFRKIKGNSNIVLYGAGDVGKTFYNCLNMTGYANVNIWVDKNYKEINEQLKKEIAYDADIPVIEAPNNIKKIKEEIDYVLICIVEECVAAVIRTFLTDMGVPDNKIIFDDYRWIE